MKKRSRTKKTKPTVPGRLGALERSVDALQALVASRAIDEHNIQSLAREMNVTFPTVSDLLRKIEERQRGIRSDLDGLIDDMRAYGLWDLMRLRELGKKVGQPNGRPR